MENPATPASNWDGGWINMSFKCILSFSHMSSCHLAATTLLQAASKKVKTSRSLQLHVSYPCPSRL